MSEVAAEEQAQMALKLADSVRELIRKEMLAAFDDPAFVTQFDQAGNGWFIDRLANKMKVTAPLRDAIKETIIQQMNKY